MHRLKPNIIAITVVVSSYGQGSHSVHAEKNPSGLIDLSEGYVLADADGKQYDKSGKMKKMDANHDGGVSRDEYMDYSERRFIRKDKNSDGTLSADELAKSKQGADGKYSQIISDS
jgi:hypothetical protein